MQNVRQLKLQKKKKPHADDQLWIKSSLIKALKISTKAVILLWLHAGMMILLFQSNLNSYLL